MEIIKWTPEEIDFLKEHYEKEGASYCSVKLKRKYQYVHKIANKLGLFFQRREREWTSEEKQFLKDNYPIYGTAYCCEKLNIRKNQLTNMVKELGIHKVTKFGKYSGHWDGYEEISGSTFGKIRTGARVRDFEFNITIEQIWELFLKQNRKCALSGIDLTFESAYKKFDATASLDRIDSKKPYTIDNVQWTHKWVNIMKQYMTDQEFIDWCHMISDYQRNNL